MQSTADLVVSVEAAIGSLGSGELMARAGFEAATTIDLGLAMIILVASFARIVSTRGLRTNDLISVIEEVTSQ